RRRPDQCWRHPDRCWRHPERSEGYGVYKVRSLPRQSCRCAPDPSGLKSFRMTPHRCLGRPAPYFVQTGSPMNQRSAITSIALCLMLLTPSVGAQPAPSSTQPAGALQQLSADFWEWRAAEQPFSFDDIPRLDRPQGWAADWSPSTIAKRRDELTAFENRWKELGK